jgi:hypothetical protein
LFEGAVRGYGQEKEAYYLYNSIVSAKVSLMLPERLERGALCPTHLEQTECEREFNSNVYWVCK